MMSRKTFPEPQPDSASYDSPSHVQVGNLISLRLQTCTWEEPAGT